MQRSWPLWAVLALAAFVRITLALLRPLQVDEGYSLHVAALPLRDGLHVLRTLDVHPPLFLLVAHFWQAVHLPDLAIRLQMTLLGVTSVWLLYGIVARWHGARAGLIAALCAALMPSLIFYDSWIRMYAPFDTIALTSFFLLSVLLTRDDLRTPWRCALWLGWTIVTALLWYTLYLGFIVSAAQLAYVAILRRDALPRSVAGLAAAALAFVPQSATFMLQLPRGGLAFPFYAQHPWQAFFEVAGQATIAVQTQGSGFWPELASCVAWPWILLAFGLAARGNAKSLALWLGAPAVLTLAYSLVAHKLLYADRYYLLLAYALCAWSGVAVERWQEKIALVARRPLALFAGGTLALLAALYTFDPMLYTANWPAVAALLQTHSQPKDLVIFDQGSPFFVLERGPSLAQHPLLLVLRRSDVPHSIELSKPFSRVWLVLFQAGPVDPQYVIFNTLKTRMHPTGLWSFSRALPAESAVVVSFAR